MSSSPPPAAPADGEFNRLLAEYWAAIENGQTPDQAEWLARNPEYATELGEFFSDWNRLHAMAALSPAKGVAEAVDQSGLLAETGSLSTAAVDDLRLSMIGRQFGSYELLSELGQGGMGVVYQARQRRPERLVALKMLRPGQLRSAADVLRFKEEAETVARLDHPHIVPLYEVGEYQGVCFYTMKWLPGGNLAKLVPQLVKDPKAAARMLVPIARAVHHAHSRGILHRDLKPSNILLDAARQPHVADFGLARRIDVDLELTRTGELIGSPPYMAPEQALGGKQEASVATDIYGLGAILYALLTGSAPARGSTVAETLRRIQEQEPPTPRSRNARVAEDLETICLKALKRRPSQRYATAECFAEDLERYLHGRPILARPTSHWERSGLWLRRNPVLAALLTSGFIIALLLMVGLGLHNSRLRSMNDQLRQSNRETNLLLYVSDMSLAAQAAQTGDTRQVRELLERHQSGPGKEDLRGFEWHHLRQLNQAEQRELEVLPTSLYFVCYSEDGRLLVTAGQDATLRFYDARSGELQGTLPTGQGEVNGVAFIAGQQRLASAGDDGSVRIWDLATRQEVLKIPAHTTRAYQVAVVPSLNLLVTCGDDPVVRLWDLKDGHSRGQLEGHVKAVEAIALSPDGRHLASASSDKTIRIWDLESRTLSRTLSGHEGRLTSVAYSGDGKWLATASLDKTVRVWNVESGETVFTLNSLDAVQSLAFSPVGRELAVGDRGGSLELWRASDQGWAGKAERVHSWHAHQGRIYQVAISPSDGSIASVGQGGQLVVSQRPRGQQQPVIRPAPGFYNMAWLAGRNWIAIATSQAVELYDVASRQAVAQLPIDDWLGIAVPASGDQLAAIDARGEVRFWDLPRFPTPSPSAPFALASLTPTHSWNIGIPPTGLYQATFSPDEKTLVVACGKQDCVYRFDAASGRRHEPLPVPDCRWPTFSPDGQSLAVASRDDIQIWNGNSGKLERILKGHVSTVNAVAYSPDGRYLASGSSDRLIKVWDIATGGELHSLSGHRGDVTGVAYSADGRSLVSCGHDGAIQLWHMATGRPLYQLDQLSQKALGLLWSSDRSHLVVALDEKPWELLLYDTRQTPLKDADASGPAP